MNGKTGYAGNVKQCANILDMSAGSAMCADCRVRNINFRTGYVRYAAISVNTANTKMMYVSIAVISVNMRI